MQLSVNCDLTDALPVSLMDLRHGDAAILEGIDLPSEDARRLMELGFLPRHARLPPDAALRVAIRKCSR